MSDAMQYVREDELGVKRVGQTRVMLDSVVAAFHQGNSAETIAQQHHALSLEEIYGAIAYYLANKEAVDQYLRSQDDVWRVAQEQADHAAGSVVSRMRDQAQRARTDGNVVNTPARLPRNYHEILVYHDCLLDFVVVCCGLQYPPFST